MKKILVTGGLGFIGCNLVNYLISKNYFIINIDKSSYSANPYNVKDFKKNLNGQILRLALISAHYKQPLDWNNELLMEQSKTLDKWYSMYSSEVSEKTPDCFNDLLDDMNTPLYISKLHELFQQSQNGDKEKIKEFNKACRLIGLFNENAK